MKRRKKERDDIQAFLAKPYDLGTWEGAVSLRRQLRSIFRASLLTTPDSLIWQAAYKTCYHMCIEQQGKVVFEVVLLVLREEGKKADLIAKLPNSDRRWGQYIFPKRHRDYTFICLILRRLGISRDLWFKIFVFSLGSFLDKEKASSAVLESCSYLSRFWIVNMSSAASRGTASFGIPLFKSVIKARLLVET